jgi:hypothetical protein
MWENERAPGEVGILWKMKQSTADLTATGRMATGVRGDILMGRDGGGILSVDLYHFSLS